MRYLKWMSLSWLLPMAAHADPLDKGEAYTTRQGPPDWMDGVDFTWLLVDYSLFALAILALGWMLMKRPEHFSRFEDVLKAPFRLLFSGAGHLPIILRELAQGLIGLGIFFLVVAWVILCQWLSHQGLGAFSMAGLALEAVILVRLIRGNEKSQPV